MTPLEYWTETLSQSLDDHGIFLSEDSLLGIAKDMQISHENYGMSFYRPESPLVGELAEVKRELVEEKEKVTCRECGGRGRIVSNGPYHSSDSQCDACRGQGRINPSAVRRR